MRPLALVVVLLLVGCGSSSPRLTHRVVGTAEWRAVLSDWYDHGRDLHDAHTCGAILLALQHLPPSTVAYSTVKPDLEHAARRACTAHPRLVAIKRGMTDEDVAAVAGLPRIGLGLTCWVYPGGGNETGRRVCFTHGRVSTLQFVVHG